MIEAELHLGKGSGVHLVSEVVLHGILLLMWKCSLQAQSTSALWQLLWLSVGLWLKFCLLKAINDFTYWLFERSVLLYYTAFKTASEIYSVRLFCPEILHIPPIFSVVLGRMLNKRKDSSFQGLGWSLFEGKPCWWQMTYTIVFIIALLTWSKLRV